MTIADILKFFANRHPQKTAVHYLDRSITYGDLNARVNMLANTFLSLGLRPNDKISILLNNCAEYVEIVFALAKIGVTSIPINARLVGEEIIYMVNNSESRGLILEEELIEKVTPIQSRLQAESDKYYLIGKGSYDGMVPYDSLFEGECLDEPDVRVEENNCFRMIYTSGTTGKPKGVMSSHRSQMLGFLTHAFEYRVFEDDIHLVAAPLFHSAGMSIAIQQLFVGGTLCIMRRFDAEEALRLIHEKGITNTFMVPTMYNFILELPEGKRSRYDVSSMRVLISSGAPLPTRIKERLIDFFHNAGLVEFYGSTEFAYATYLKPEDQLRKTACAGKPFWGVEIKLLNENGEPVPVNEVGEIFVKSPYMMEGYYKRDTEGFEGEWFSVGDLGKLDEEGYLYIVDRRVDMIISGGVNIYPVQIEEVLYSHPKILEVAVIGVPDERWGESVRAVVVLKEGETANEMEIIDYCRERMAGYKIPKSVTFEKTLPKSPYGKILKRELREAYWKGKDVKV